MRLENTRRRRQEQRAAVPRRRRNAARRDGAERNRRQLRFRATFSRLVASPPPDPRTPRASTETTAPVSSHARTSVTASPCAWPRNAAARAKVTREETRAARGEVHLARARARLRRRDHHAERGRVTAGCSKARIGRIAVVRTVGPIHARSRPRRGEVRRRRRVREPSASFRRARRARPPRPARVARGARAARADARSPAVASKPSSIHTHTAPSDPSAARKSAPRAREQPRRRTRRLRIRIHAFANVPPPASPAKTAPCRPPREPRSRASRRALRGSGATRASARRRAPGRTRRPRVRSTTTVCARRTGASVATRRSRRVRTRSTRAAPSSEVVTSATVFVKKSRRSRANEKRRAFPAFPASSAPTSPPWGAAGSARGTRARPRRAPNASPAPPTRRAPRRSAGGQRRVRFTRRLRDDAPSRTNAEERSTVRRAIARLASSSGASVSSTRPRAELTVRRRRDERRSVARPGGSHHLRRAPRAADALPRASSRARRGTRRRARLVGLVVVVSFRGRAQMYFASPRHEERAARLAGCPRDATRGFPFARGRPLVLAFGERDARERRGETHVRLRHHHRVARGIRDVRAADRGALRLEEHAQRAGGAGGDALPHVQPGRERRSAHRADAATPDLARVDASAATRPRPPSPR